MFKTVSSSDKVGGNSDSMPKTSVCAISNFCSYALFIKSLQTTVGVTGEKMRCQLTAMEHLQSYTRCARIAVVMITAPLTMLSDLDTPSFVRLSALQR
jgi:hypothetical protein